MAEAAMQPADNLQDTLGRCCARAADGDALRAR